MFMKFIAAAGQNCRRLNASGDRPPKNFGLTKREMDILTTIVAGLSNKEIAAKLHMSEATVKLHISNTLSKLHVADRTQAAIVAVQRGIIHLDA